METEKSAKGFGWYHALIKAKRMAKDMREFATELDKLVDAKEAELEREKLAPPKEKPNKSGEVIAEYCIAWKKRYKTSPTLTGAQVGQITRLLKDMSSDKLKALLNAYLQMNDTWFIRKRHDLICFQQNLQAIAHFSDTGAVITNTKLQQMDMMTNLNDLSHKVDRGEA